MTHDHHEALWRGFPRTQDEFDARFSCEDACRAYLIECRWNGEPRCKRCAGKNLWTGRAGRIYECADCRHQTSLTSGTLFEGTRKPLRTWFRAIFEVCVRRNGISAADLQRILGFGSYGTAWLWLHKIRRAMVRESREKLTGCTQLDETFVGGKGSEKETVVVVGEEHGRVRLIHAPGNHAEALKVVAEHEIAPETVLKTDGHAAYNKTSLGERKHDCKVQTAVERSENDHLQLCHWNASNVKRWLLGTHHGGVGAKHLQSYLDEYSFRYNRRRTNGVCRIAARCLENMLLHSAMTMRQLIDNTHECRNFADASY